MRPEFDEESFSDTVATRLLCSILVVRVARDLLVFIVFTIIEQIESVSNGIGTGHQQVTWYREFSDDPSELLL